MDIISSFSTETLVILAIIVIAGFFLLKKLLPYIIIGAAVICFLIYSAKGPAASKEFISSSLEAFEKTSVKAFDSGKTIITKTTSK